MRAKMTFLVLIFCLIVCAFPIHRSAGHAVDDFLSPAPASSFNGKRHKNLVAAPPKRTFESFPSTSHSHSHGKAPARHSHSRPPFAAPGPYESPVQHSFRGNIKSFAASPENSYYKRHQHQHLHHHHRHTKNQYDKSAEAMGPTYAVSPFHSRYPSTRSRRSPMAAPSPIVSQVPTHPPSLSPLTVKMAPPPSSTLALPPPPPNQDCTAITCTEPLTYTPSGFPCGCVSPMQVKLRLYISLYTFFPLVSELAAEIASSLSLNQSQVRVMGATAASQQLKKTIVLVNLVPLEAKFKHVTAFSMYGKFWQKKIHINLSLFRAYDVLDVHYPGLPPSPPSVASNVATIDEHPYPANSKDNGGSLLKPLGVDVPRRQKKGSSGSVLAVVIISSITAFVICAAIAWILIVRCRCSAPRLEEALATPMSSFTKPSGAARSLALGSKSLSGSLSFGSGALTFTGSAKVFSLHEIEKATNSFDSSRVLGEGGFGVVYRGTFDDGEQVAVKVLKRDNRHGVREFLSEVEMLSRLHHRNLVKLIGICTEDHIRCLVYELVPNGSVESHLHGVDKEVDPLDWATRMKIALGAARGLAYLHEDSSPCVIHRDFKSSNILLEHDFTPKVSDFGLARNALNEGNQPISTHVIGTFGYLAPEYAMTGHLLVKSDVYSYGVVLLELLTGRKPVDFTKPPGEENLVSWAHPLLTNNEGLESLMDPTLKPTAPFESVSKVAAIASMCVQPEVSRRPFMGEVVQALKLVCSEFDDAKEEELHSNEGGGKSGQMNQISGEIQEFFGCSNYSGLGYESSFEEGKIAISATDLVSASIEYKEQEYVSLRRQYSSGPLGLGERKRKFFWEKLGRFSRGKSMKERLWPGSH